MRVFKCIIVIFLLFYCINASVKDSPVYGYHLREGVIKALRIRSQEKVMATLRIIGGSQVKDANAVPYQAGIIATLTSRHTSVCGGSLITNSRVLTAAHCWYDGESQASLFTVVLGSLTIFSGGTKRETSDVIVHPLWAKLDLKHDIAVVKIKAVSLSNTIQVIPLPTAAEAKLNFEGLSGQISGYGKTKDTQTSFPTTTSLHHATVKIISNAVCQNSFRISLDSSHLCVSGLEGRGTCEGDSGGPLMIMHDNKRILIGVVSFGSDEGCEARTPSVFTRVTSFLTWIDSQLK